jgi:hypothetical protein
MLPDKIPGLKSSRARLLLYSGAKSDVSELAQSTARLDPLRHNIWLSNLKIVERGK